MKLIGCFVLLFCTLLASCMTIQERIELLESSLANYNSYIADYKANHNDGKTCHALGFMVGCIGNLAADAKPAKESQKEYDATIKATISKLKGARNVAFHQCTKFDPKVFAESDKFVHDVQSVITVFKSGKITFANDAVKETVCKK